MAMSLPKEQRVKAVQHYYQNNKNGPTSAIFLLEGFNIRLVPSRNITSLIR